SLLDAQVNSIENHDTFPSERKGLLEINRFKSRCIGHYIRRCFATLSQAHSDTSPFSDIGEPPDSADGRAPSCLSMSKTWRTVITRTGDCRSSWRMIMLWSCVTEHARTLRRSGGTPWCHRFVAM